MDPVKELDLRVAAKQVGRSLNEIIHVTVHLAGVSPYRHNEAINGFADSIVELAKVLERK